MKKTTKNVKKAINVKKENLFSRLGATLEDAEKRQQSYEDNVTMQQW